AGGGAGRRTGRVQRQGRGGRHHHRFGPADVGVFEPGRPRPGAAGRGRAAGGAPAAAVPLPPRKPRAPAARARCVMRLKDQVAIVTGGSRGIGRAVVKAFAAEGAKVALVYRGSREAAESAVAEVAGAGGTALALQADRADAAAVQQAVERVEKEWGRLDVLVNNAGVIKDDLFVRMEPDAWHAVLQTNLGGTYNFCRAVAYTMMKQRRGRIINVSSVA